MNFGFDENKTPNAADKEVIVVFTDGILEDDELQKFLERYNDIQSTREQEIKEKQLNKYYETAKPLVDLLSTLYDILRPIFIKGSSQLIGQKMKTSEIGQVKPYNLDEDYRDIIEPMNPFDVLTALMSLMNGQYSDLIMESNTNYYGRCSSFKKFG